tara:strand:- start:217 stop:429 length:213 start_codon:yes stop_codon:yes gene_type:complete
MQIRQTLIEQVEQFRNAKGWSESRFGLECANDHKLLKKLREGRVTLSTMETMEQFIATAEGSRPAEVVTH